MNIIVAGATGATGRHVVKQLLDRGVKVMVIVRSAERFRSIVDDSEGLTIIEAGISEISNEKLAEIIEGADGFVSCLGHNLNLKGIYGKPRRLVTDTVEKICSLAAEKSHESPFKYILMNTTGNMNHDLPEHRTAGETIVMGLVRLLLPPQSDNEHAAEYLRTQIGAENSSIEWTAVRPDTLINEDDVSSYEVHRSPIRSAVFNAGETSRINIGHFMAELITDSKLWDKWKGQMPVIYNKAAVGKMR